MKILQNNHAYIDGTNLYRGVKSLGWKLDYARFRVWLRERYHVTHAYIFMGWVDENQELYEYLKNAGFTIIFKKTTRHSDDSMKGNVDAEIVLRATCDTFDDEYDESIVVTSDGDFACLIQFLAQRKRLAAVIAPNTCSRLIKNLQLPIVYIRDVRSLIESTQCGVHT